VNLTRFEASALKTAGRWFNSSRRELNEKRSLRFSGSLFWFPNQEPRRGSTVAQAEQAARVPGSGPDTWVAVNPYVVSSGYIRSTRLYGAGGRFVTGAEVRVVTFARPPPGLARATLGKWGQEWKWRAVRLKKHESRSLATPVPVVTATDYVLSRARGCEQDKAPTWSV